MLKKLIATAAVLTVVAAASATITAWHDPAGEPSYTGTLTTGDAYEVYRIYAEVTTTPGMTEDDDWTTSGLDIALTGATFFQESVFGGNPPNPALFPSFPDVEWDTYYTSPADYPNTTYDGAIVGIAFSDDTATALNTDWFDTHETGNGVFVLASMTVIADAPGPWEGTGLMQYAAADTGGTLFDLPIFIPEPASLALVALGGLALIRRR